MIRIKPIGVREQELTRKHIHMMTTNRSTLVLPAVVFLTVLLNGPAFAHEEFHSTFYGYSLDLPPGWVEIPRDVLQETFAAMQKEGATPSIIYDAGFQLESSDRLLEYPYVLVQPLSYATFGIHRQINEDEFPRFVQKITGRDVGKVLDEKLAPDARQLFGNLDVGQPILDAAHRRYLFPIDMDVQEGGAIRGLIAGYFGRDSVVQVNFYSRRSDWDRHADVRNAILDSFRFDSDKAYSVELAAANPSPPPVWKTILDKSFSGALIGGSIALIFAGIRAAKRKKSTPAQDAPEDNAR